MCFEREVTTDTYGEIDQRRVDGAGVEARSVPLELISAPAGTVTDDDQPSALALGERAVLGLSRGCCSASLRSLATAVASPWVATWAMAFTAARRTPTSSLQQMPRDDSL